MQEKSATNQNSVKVVGKTWDNLKLLKRDVISSANPNNPNPTPTNAIPPLTPSTKITVGQSLLVTLPTSPFYGKLGTVTRLFGVKNVELSIGSLSSRFKRNELSIPNEAQSDSVDNNNNKSPKISKRVIAEEEATRQQNFAAQKKKKGKKP
ncbi:hypothetical protein TL16_g02891 [Triparma laevis f. inornata]|uniref:Uncharacterized protein n=1 Tax=Triparma laevis f. inornata TaxID=1714386 RepID=A0A9W6ZWK8_9STRA|nr:hypothetical protein TL16_g02891 [Triparma laevis f. inornata]